MKHLLTVGSSWVYKDVFYLIQEVQEKTLIQYNGEWGPSVSYITAPAAEGDDIPQNYVRSQQEFLEKFVFRMHADEISLAIVMPDCDSQIVDHIIRKRDTIKRSRGEAEGYAYQVLDALVGELKANIHVPPVDPLTAMREIITWIGGINVEAGWWKDANHDLRYADSKVLRQSFVGAKIALVHSEASEALEGWRKSSATKTLMDDHLPQHPMVAVELADILVRVCDLAANVRLLEGDKPLDVALAFVEKIQYNQTRADHKPEARAADGGKGI